MKILFGIITNKHNDEPLATVGLVKKLDVKNEFPATWALDEDVLDGAKDEVCAQYGLTKDDLILEIRESEV